MTYNLTATIIEAHKCPRASVGNEIYKGRSYASAFVGQLSRVWAEAKRRKRIAVEQAIRTEADRTLHVFAALLGKDRWTQADYARIGVLRAALRANIEHEEAAPDYAEKRDQIGSAGGRFCAVTCTKADGTERIIQVQPATLQHHVKGDKVTKAGKQAVATRKARHPNLLPVWDAPAKAPRSVNLATISRIALDCAVHEYRV